MTPSRLCGEESKQRETAGCARRNRRSCACQRRRRSSSYRRDQLGFGLGGPLTEGGLAAPPPRGPAREPAQRGRIPSEPSTPRWLRRRTERRCRVTEFCEMRWITEPVASRVKKISLLRRDGTRLVSRVADVDRACRVPEGTSVKRAELRAADRPCASARPSSAPDARAGMDARRELHGRPRQCPKDPGLGPRSARRRTRQSGACGWSVQGFRRKFGPPG